MGIFMAINMKSYNPFDYLETKVEINDYMNNAYMDGYPRVFLVSPWGIYRRNREILYKYLAGEGNPKFSAISRVIKTL
jgi:DNA-binding phage protein